MHSSVSKVVVSVLLTSIAVFAADNSIGTWKLNPAKSKSTVPMYKSRTLVIESVPGGVKHTVTGERSDGSSANTTFTAMYDGKNYPVTGGRSTDTVSLRQVDANRVRQEQMKAGGKYHFIAQNVVSRDGKTMTHTSKGTDADGKKLSGRFVYEKQ